MELIQVNNLTKIFKTRLKRGNITALNEVSLSVRQGEIFGLLGPNGAGKTTLVKIILGITHATSGEVMLAGLDSNNPEARQSVGYLAENHRFPHYLTGLGLLELAGRLQGLSEPQIDSRAERLLPLVGMDRWASTKLRKYSKGMLQRIGLAQAMMPDPDLLILDEPTDGVDPVGKVEIRKVLEKIKADGKTVFINTHLLSEVEPIADRVAILQRGRLARLDTVENLTRRGSQYDIKASVGHRLIEIPKEIGQVLSVSTSGLVVEVATNEALNHVIDHLRAKDILIQSVRPMTVSLEQSFFEIVSEPEEGQS